MRHPDDYFERVILLAIRRSQWGGPAFDILKEAAAVIDASVVQWPDADTFRRIIEEDVRAISPQAIE